MEDTEKKFPPTEVVEAKKKGTIVLELTGEDGDKYYFRKPNKADMNRYLAGAATGKLASAVTNLVYGLAIHPAQDELEKRVEERPGLMVALNNAIQNAIGLNEEFHVKNL